VRSESLVVGRRLWVWQTCVTNDDDSLLCARDGDVDSLVQEETAASSRTVTVEDNRGLVTLSRVVAENTGMVLQAQQRLVGDPCNCTIER
jgi:hypothetical protein